MQRIIERVALFAIPLVLLAGCATTGSSSASVRSFMGATPDQQSQSSELSAGNTIEVSIEVDGSMEVISHRAQINQQGMVTLPLVGDVKIDGYTLSKARGIIADTYGAYYVNPPVVMISLLIDPEDGGEWGDVTVTGRVGQPGRVPLRSQNGMNLTEAIQLAGGFAPSAKKSDIHISRTDELGMKTKVVVDYEDIGRGGDASSDIKLIAGDIVYVPERIF